MTEILKPLLSFKKRERIILSDSEDEADQINLGTFDLKNSTNIDLKKYPNNAIEDHRNNTTNCSNLDLENSPNLNLENDSNLVLEISSVPNPEIPPNIDSLDESQVNGSRSTVISTEIENIKVPNFKYSDIFDAEADDEEEDVNKSRNTKPRINSDASDENSSNETPINDELKKKLAKGAARKVKGSSKSNMVKSKDNLMQLHSETQRIIRESSINIPYHQPEKPSLDAILASAKMKQQKIFTKIKPSFVNHPIKAALDSLTYNTRNTKTSVEKLGVVINSRDKENLADISTESNRRLNIPDLKTRLFLNKNKGAYNSIADECFDRGSNVLTESTVCKVLFTPSLEGNNQETGIDVDTLVYDNVDFGYKSRMDNQDRVDNEKKDLPIAPNLNILTDKIVFKNHSLLIDSEIDRDCQLDKQNTNSEENNELRITDSPSSTKPQIVTDGVKEISIRYKCKDRLKDLVLPTLTPSLSTDIIDFEDNENEVSQFQSRLFQHVGNSKKSLKKDVVINTVTKEIIENHEELKMNHITYKFDIDDDTTGSKLATLREMLQDKMRLQREDKLQKRYDQYNKMSEGRTADRMEEDCLQDADNSDSESDGSSGGSDVEPDTEEEEEDEEELAIKKNPFIDEEADDDSEEDDDYIAEVSDDEKNINDEHENDDDVDDDNEDSNINVEKCDDVNNDDNALEDDRNAKYADDKSSLDNFYKLDDPISFDPAKNFLRQSSNVDEQKRTPAGSKESSFEWNAEYSCSLIPAAQPIRSKRVTTPSDIFPDSSNAVSVQELKFNEDFASETNFARTQSDTSAALSFEKNHLTLETSINTQNPEFEWLLGSKNKIAKQESPKFSLSTLELSQCANDDILMLCSGKFSSQELHFTQPNQSQSELNGSTFNFGSISLKRKLDDDDESEDDEKLTMSNMATKRRAVILDDNDDSVSITKSDDHFIDKNNDDVIDDDDVEEDDADVNDDDEEEILKSIKGPNGKINRRFLDEEAELSGEDDEASEDGYLDDQADEMEVEEGDADELGTEEELKDQVHRIHLKSIIDEDKRELLMLQEQFLPDGDLHSDEGGRMKRFRWNIKEQDSDQPSNDFSNFLENQLPDLVGDDSELSWRVERREREKFIENLDREERANEAPFFSIKSASSSNSLNENPTILHVKENFKIPMLNRSGSFLSRNRESLTKMSTKTDVNLNPKNSKNFVFSTVKSPDKKDKFNKPLVTKKVIKMKSIDFSSADSNSSSSNLLRLLNEDSNSQITF